MKLPLPDFGKEIKVGDPSFVYKGIYNAIYWDGDVPYRPRVENLVIRNGKEVFLRLYDDVNDGFTYRYRLPGGSLDNDSTKIKQAENETNEEALLKVKNIVSSGIMYFDQFPEGHLLKKGDICLAYRGNITDVFVSEYAGKMDKSKIDPHDLDDDMANNGKFYYITQIAQLLRQEHVDALLNSSLIDDVTKTLMLRLRRGDIEAKKTYRNLYDEVIPDNKNYESLFESVNTQTKKIYLVASHYKSLFGNTVRLITGGYYNHAGLALDKNLDKMYTYSRRTDMNEGRYLGGFAIESFKDFRHGKTDDIDIKVISCDVTKDQYDFVKEKMEYLSKNISKTHYNFANLLTTAFNIPVSDNFSSDTVSICSVFVATVMKAIGHPVSDKPVNLVTPDDIAACDSMKGFKSVYTGGVDRFKPVTEQNNVYELESVPKDVKIYHGSPVQGIKEVKAFHNDRIYSELGPVVFASEYPAFSACYGTRWNDKVMKQYTSWENDKLVGVSVKVIDPEILKEWDKPCSLYLLENNGTFKRLPNHPCEVINPNPVKVKKEIKFKSFYDMLKQYRVTIDAPDSGELSNVLKESTLCRTNRAKQLAKVKEMMNPVSEIGAFSTSTTGGGGITLASLRRDKIDQHIINTLSKQFKSLEHVRVDENCNGYIYFDRESSPVAIINVEELPNGKKVIQNLTVVSSYSDSGLEDQLINVAVKELGANFATVSKKNEELIKIYKDNGFREVGDSMISVSLQRGQIVEESSVIEAKRSELPDSEFGIPSQRKYELDTKKHVLSAIKLFNWVDEEHEEELARNILKKIDEFHISDDEIHCTEKNRFYNYWKGGK